MSLDCCDIILSLCYVGFLHPSSQNETACMCMCVLMLALSGLGIHITKVSQEKGLETLLFVCGN